jgi:hypothetical protein
MNHPHKYWRNNMARLEERKKKRPVLELLTSPSIAETTTPTGAATPKSPLLAATGMDSGGISFDPRREAKLQGIYDRFLKRAEETKYRKSAQVFGQLASIVGERIAANRAGRIGAAETLAQTGAAEAGTAVKRELGLKGIAEDIEKRKADVGIRRGQLDVAERRTDIYGKEQEAQQAYWERLGEAKGEEPTFLEKQRAKLEVAEKKAKTDVVKKFGPPEEREGFLGFGAGPNKPMERMEAIGDIYDTEEIRAQLAKPVDLKTVNIKTVESHAKKLGIPTYEELRNTMAGKGVDLSPERYRLFIESQLAEANNAR